MIKFVCRCGNKMQASDDEAGLTLQCKRCGLLVDIPMVSDKDSLEGDGTYRLDNPTVAKPNENLDQLTLMYYPARQLPDGTEIDLRGPVEPMPMALISDDTPGAPRPKYDPETGELVQELGVGESIKPPPNAELPEARRVVDYNVSMNAMGGSPHGMGIFPALFQPLNVIVMTLIFGIHIFLLMSLIVGAAFIVLIAAPFAVAAFLAGHYATVLEEMGPAERDELPRPLRNVNPWDDFLVPFGKMLFSLALCYWPMVVVLFTNISAMAVAHPDWTPVDVVITALMAGSDTAPGLPFPRLGFWMLGIWLLGSIFFPTVFLTVCTSGTMANLRPDRLIKFMYHAGWRCVGYVLLWAVTGAIYSAGVVGTLLHSVALFTSGSVPIFLRSLIVYPLLLAGIYLAHGFCWVLGSYYRQEWRNFPWVAQYHERKVVTLHRPKLHPKVEAADQNAAARAAKRSIR